MKINIILIIAFLMTASTVSRKFKPELIENHHLLPKNIKSYYEHTEHVFEWKDVTNPYTGKTWMDRNLGAFRVAIEINDSNSFGDLYQWGRLADGHQLRHSKTTKTTSPSDIPNHGDFIIEDRAPFDWRKPKQNDSLWQGLNGTNNPCPKGYRIPSDDDWIEEIKSWDQKNAQGAILSTLKLPLGGFRKDGVVKATAIAGLYWSSSINSRIGKTGARAIYINSQNVNILDFNRVIGLSVRCIKD